MKQKFKTMRLFDRLERKYDKILKEADEEETSTEEVADEGEGEGEGEIEGDDATPEDGGEDMGDMGEEPAQEEDPQEEESPEEFVGKEAGTFISDTKMAEFAKTLLDAYLANPPKTDEIPSDLLNVTTHNSAAVITYITSLISLNKSTNTEGANSEVEQELRQVNI